jgi:hypothetical protein
MNVEIGAEAAQFPEKEYINGIAVAVIGCQCQLFTRTKFNPSIPLKDKTHRRQSKMSSSKKIDLKSDFVAGAYLFEAHNPPPPTPLHTVYVYTVYLSTKWGGGEGGELNQREG